MSNSLSIKVFKIFYAFDIAIKQRKRATRQLNYLIDLFKNAEELGSIIKVEGDFEAKLLLKFIEDFDKEGQISFETIGIEETQQQLVNLVKTAELLKGKYEVVVTNPPYMNKFDINLKKYINDNYMDYSGDLFSVFIYRNIELLKNNGYSAYMSPFVWMFIKSYEKLRRHIISNKSISSLIQMEYSAFEEATVPICSFVLKNGSEKKKGMYLKLSEFKGGMEIQRQKVLEALNNKACGYYYETSDEQFCKIQGFPIAYWASEAVLNIFQNSPKIADRARVKKGLDTGDNKKFLRLWYEVNHSNVFFGCSNREQAIESKKKWFPCNKGGSFRKWYGNNDYVIDWFNDGENLRKTGKATLRSPQYYFREGITWSTISSTYLGMRYSPKGFIFETAGNMMFPNDDMLYILGLLCGKLPPKFLECLNPTITTTVGSVSLLPIINQTNYKSKIEELTLKNIEISKNDWDSFETSWDFSKSPLLNGKTIREAFDKWDSEAQDLFNQMKDNEEELNRIFIEIYGLENEVTPEIEDKDVTIRKADLQRDVRAFISYAVGCIFGRYNLYNEGLIYAGGLWDENINSAFVPNKDNIIPITDEEYFKDDVVDLFTNFVKQAYGKETLEENLDFIAKALGNKRNSSREVIRNYFFKDFFKDHCKTYQNRPIYWLFDSGKQNGFKALVYMHRYDEDTTGKVRVDYLHQVQKTYERTTANLQDDIANSKDAKEITQLQKRIEKITKQLKECKDYDERLGHIALERISIDLDDGVIVNYQKVQTDSKAKVHQILAKIK